jgi:predicted flavoprotein YhiN
MLVSAQKTTAIQPSQRSDMDPSTAAASALYSGLMQNVQNTATLQASQAVQQASNTVSDNVAAAFAKTRVLLQATPPTASTAQANSTTQSSALDEFKDYMNKSPEQRMRDRILEEMGITEEDLKNMPPEKQQAVAQEIAQRVQDKLKLAQVEKDASGIEKQVTDKFLAAL